MNQKLSVGIDDFKGRKLTIIGKDWLNNWNSAKSGSIIMYQFHGFSFDTPTGRTVGIYITKRRVPITVSRGTPVDLLAEMAFIRNDAVERGFSKTGVVLVRDSEEPQDKEFTE